MENVTIGFILKIEAQPAVEVEMEWKHSTSGNLSTRPALNFQGARLKSRPTSIGNWIAFFAPKFRCEKWLVAEQKNKSIQKSQQMCI